MQNERHDDRFYIQYTFFDMISNMRTEYDRLCKIQKRVVGQDVVNVYCGYNTTTKKVSTLIQTANTVIRLPISVINVIGEICNAEHPDLVLSNAKLNRSKSISTDEVMRQEDCRVYRNFLHLTSLKSAKAFMNAKHPDGERAQIYSIYRCQDIYRQRSFSKAIQPDEVSRQYELSLYSIEEEKKFLKYISPDNWPKEMGTLRQNLLRTIQLSDDVVLNHGNKEVLPCLLKAYKRHFPGRFIVKEHKSQSSLESSKKVPEKQTAPHQQTSSRSASFAPNPVPVPEGVPSEKKNSVEVQQNTSVLNEVHHDPLLDKINSLKEKGINCHNVKWQEFLSESWSVKNKLLDAIITEPPPSPSLSFIHNENKKKPSPSSSNEELSSADIMEITRSGKRFLKPGGYFIVLIEFEMFQHWYLSFVANGYKVMRKPLTFSYKQCSVARRPSDELSFPYGMEDYCVVARLPGAHPDGFNPNFNTNFNLIECSWSRRTSIVTNVDVPRNRLCYPNSRKPVRMSEKPINLLAEIIDLFVPAYGTVMDLFGGTFTLPIAALKTSRRCIAIEMDSKCFELSVDRIHQLCDPVFKFILNQNKPTKTSEERTETISETYSEGGVAGSLKSSDTAKASINQISPSFLTNSVQETSRDPDDTTNVTEVLSKRQTKPRDLSLKGDIVATSGAGCSEKERCPPVECQLISRSSTKSIQTDDRNNIQIDSQTGQEVDTDNKHSLKESNDLEASKTLLLLTGN